MSQVRSGAERIAIERARQVSEESYDAKHDTQHCKGDLAMAAACYAANAAGTRIYTQETHAATVCFTDPWPWDREDDRRCYGYGDKRSNVLQAPNTNDSIRLLEKAGALIAAEIDALLREKAIQEKARASE